MAASVLAGVNPVYGRYASFAGPIAGGVLSSTRLMVVTTTSAAALATFLAGVPSGLLHRLDQTHRLELGRKTEIYELTSIRGESTLEAAAAADRWLADRLAPPDRR